MVIKLAENDESTEIPVQIEESNAEENLEVEESDIEEKLEVDEIEIKQLTDLLSKEKEKNNSLEDKLKHTLADFQNLTQRHPGLPIDHEMIRTAPGARFSLFEKAGDPRRGVHLSQPCLHLLETPNRIRDLEEAPL